MSGRRRIVVSIDFGTTYSGVAWADTNRPDVQHVITQWPSSNGNTSSPKVPTELRRVANGWQWGFQIPDKAKRIRLFKLKLDDTTYSYPDGETPHELTKIYLSCLHAHFIQVLGQKLSPEVVRSTPMDFVVTVPAIWSSMAKQATERAAAMAGFCGNKRITLVSEPEAAALYTMSTSDNLNLKRGQKYLLCDAGGGTVDLITHEVSAVDRLQLKEVTEGTGGRCGSGMLNLRFRRYLKQTHGESKWPDSKLVLALNEFESFKKTFTPKGEPLTLRVDSSLGLKRNRFTVPREDMKSKIFEPIVRDIICLVEEQVAMAGGPITAVVLVGGFGQNRYLKTRVKEAVGKDVRVLQPDDGWTAVVKGAVIHGLGGISPSMSPVKIASRVARRSYGTCLLTKYDASKHDAKEAFWDEKEEETMVFVMLWFIRKGESYPEDRPSTIDYQCDIPVHLGKAPQTDIEIFVNDQAKPPTHLDSKTQCLAVLSLDVSNISDLVKSRSNVQRMGGFRYYSIGGVIEATYGSAMVTYRAMLGGTTHAVLRIDYER